MTPLRATFLHGLREDFSDDTSNAGWPADEAVAQPGSGTRLEECEVEVRGVCYDGGWMSQSLSRCEITLRGVDPDSPFYVHLVYKDESAWQNGYPAPVKRNPCIAALRQALLDLPSEMHKRPPYFATDPLLVATRDQMSSKESKKRPAPARPVGHAGAGAHVFDVLLPALPLAVGPTVLRVGASQASPMECACLGFNSATYTNDPEEPVSIRAIYASNQKTLYLNLAAWHPLAGVCDDGNLCTLPPDVVNGEVVDSVLMLKLAAR